MEHACALRDELAPLDPDEFYDTAQIQRPKPDKQGGIWYDGYLIVRKQPPPKLGILAGDWAHNLRGSLDHLVYQLAVLDSRPGKAPEGTFFPIAKTEREYTDPGPCGTASLRDRALAGITEPHRALIDAEQPYVGRTREEADRHLFSVLNAFTNTDKHRLINPAAVMPFGLEATPEGGQFTIKIVLPAKPPLTYSDGAHLYALRITNVPPYREMGVKVDLTFAIGFGNRGLTDGDLLSMVSEVRGFIDKFRPLFP